MEAVCSSETLANAKILHGAKIQKFIDMFSLVHFNWASPPLNYTNRSFENRMCPQNSFSIKLKKTCQQTHTLSWFIFPYE
jgi:hypothetical protein